MVLPKSVENFHFSNRYFVSYEENNERPVFPNIFQMQYFHASEVWLFFFSL